MSLLLSGAGQEVGKSCVVVTINGKRIMFDCGMHMGFLDRRRYPDFSRISASRDYNAALSCVIITHLYVIFCSYQQISVTLHYNAVFLFVVSLLFCSHLDHIGALPYFTEVCGYNGPIYMTVKFI